MNEHELDGPLRALVTSTGAVVGTLRKTGEGGTAPGFAGEQLQSITVSSGLGGTATRSGMVK